MLALACAWLSAASKSLPLMAIHLSVWIMSTQQMATRVLRSRLTRSFFMICMQLGRSSSSGSLHWSEPARKGFG